MRASYSPRSPHKEIYNGRDSTNVTYTHLSEAPPSPGPRLQPTLLSKMQATVVLPHDSTQMSFTTHKLKTLSEEQEEQAPQTEGKGEQAHREVIGYCTAGANHRLQINTAGTSAMASDRTISITGTTVVSKVGRQSPNKKNRSNHPAQPLHAPNGNTPGSRERRDSTLCHTTEIHTSMATFSRDSEGTTNISILRTSQLTHRSRAPQN